MTNATAHDMPLRVAALNAHAASMEAMRSAVSSLGCEFQGFRRSRDFLGALPEQDFDMLLLAWHLPDLDGAEVMRRLRNDMASRMPAMVVAQRATKKELMSGLSAGADMFLVAPQPPELSARLKALIRRAFPKRHAAPTVFGPYRFSPDTYTLHVHDEPVELQFRDYDLARFLFQNAGSLLTRKRICEAVGGMGIGRSEKSRALDTRISRIRTRLNICAANGYILSATYGQGYRLDAVNVDTMTSTGFPD